MRKRYNEYLDNSRKMQEKPIISVQGNTSPKPTFKPSKAVTKGKTWNANVPNENPNPYSGASLKPTDKKTIEKGLGYLGDKNLIYEPDTIEDTEYEDDSFSFPKEKTSTVWGSNQTEQFLNKTKNMSLSEFVRYIKENYNQSGSLPIQELDMIKKTANIVAENNNLLENLILEFKKLGILENLTKKLLLHKECYKQIAHNIVNSYDGLNNSRKLVNAVLEVVAPPAGETENKFKKKKKKKQEPSQETPSPEEMPMEKIENTLIKAMSEFNLIS